ncbi:hypothetical protein BaRGS_00024644 [Batillaria attramentaria]|uniref:CUB domain-containing protein n=1 Tax=Batillaria attramentaria TaxID=370345 RepID=A0ABD0KAP6_9CAEN
MCIQKMTYYLLLYVLRRPMSRKPPEQSSANVTTDYLPLISKLQQDPSGDMDTVIAQIGGMTWGMTPLRHMSNFCSQTLHVNESLLLDLTEELPADRVSVGYLTCVTTVHAPPGTRIIAHVLQMAICDNIEKPDRLHIFDVSISGRETRLTPSSGLFGVLERPVFIYNTAGIIVPDFKSRGSRMRFNYQGKPTLIYRGFRVLITVFNDPDANGACRSDSLFCPYAGTCIPRHVRCDGLPNCGLDDSEDEKSCQREDVVTNLLEEFSTRTAVIAGVTGSLVFLACAAVVAFVLFKYNRHKYYRGQVPRVHYTSRGGGTCRVKDEEELTNLYAPPSYEDIMAPGSTSRHHGPPPAYHTVAAVHTQKGYDSSDDESARMSRSTRHTKLKPHLTQERGQLPELKRMRNTCTTDSDEDVRMHGTWPSDTDEEEEVRARRKRKGGKCKGRLRRASQGGSASESSSGKATKDDRKENKLGVRRQESRGIRSPSSPSYPCSPEDPESGSLTATSKSESESSPLRTQCVKCLVHAECSCDVIGARGSEGVSETESQLAGSERNSRTESNSRSASPASTHSENPAKILDSPAKNLDSPAKHVDSLAKHADSPAKHQDIQANNPDRPATHLDNQGSAVCKSPSKSSDSLSEEVPNASDTYKGSSFVDLNPAADKNKARSEGMKTHNGEVAALDVGVTLVAPR